MLIKYERLLLPPRIGEFQKQICVKSLLRLFRAYKFTLFRLHLIYHYME